MIRAFAHDRFTYPLPDDHRFPLGRYRMLREAIEAQGVARVEEADGATDADLLLAHDPLYFERVVTGRLTDREQKAVGLPWSPELVERGRRSVGATVAAAHAALDDGAGINLGGGPKRMADMQLSVRIDDAATGQALWEGRALAAIPVKAPASQPSLAAAKLAEALFKDFPGESGRTISVP